jgi:hypothetical protein
MSRACLTTGSTLLGTLYVTGFVPSNHTTSAACPLMVMAHATVKILTIFFIEICFILVFCLFYEGKSTTFFRKNQEIILKNLIFKNAKNGLTIW